MKPTAPLVYFGGVSNGVDQYIPIQTCAGSSLSSTSESAANIRFNQAGILSKMRVRVNVNAATQSTVFTLRKNGGNGNITLTIPATSIGTFTSDVSLSDTVSPGDDCCVFVDKNASGAITVLSLSLQFLSTDKRYFINKIGCFFGTALAFSSISATRFLSIEGSNVATTTTETSATHMQTDFDFTAKNLRVWITANTRPNTSTIRFRNNGADGNQVISVGAGLTGFFSDITNEDSVTSGTRPGYSITNGSSAGTLSLGSIGCDSYSSENYCMAWAKEPLNYSANGVRYSSAFGSLMSSGSINLNQNPVYGEGFIDRLRINITANTKSGSTTVDILKNGVVTSLSITVTAGSTGDFSDINNTVYFTSEDELQVRITTTSTGTFTMVYSSFRIKFNSGNRPKVVWI